MPTGSTSAQRGHDVFGRAETVQIKFLQGAIGVVSFGVSDSRLFECVAKSSTGHRKFRETCIRSGRCDQSRLHSCPFRDGTIHEQKCPAD